MWFFLVILPFYLIAHSVEVMSFGGACADIIIHVPESFLADYAIEKGGSQVVNESYFEKLRFASLSYPSEIHPGGSSCNTIRGLARLNHKATFIGKIGNDDVGEIFTKSLTRNYVNAVLLMSEKPTMQVISFVTPDGERTMRCLRGASNDLNVEDLNKEFFHGIKLLHIEGYSLFDLPMTEKAMSLAKNEGAAVSLDLSSFEIIRRYRKELLRIIPQYVDILFCNEQEAFEMTQKPPHEASLELAQLAKIAVVAVGEKGAYVADSGNAIYVGTKPLPIVDATGAGDLFAAGFLHGFLSNVSLETAVRWGHLTGGAVIQVQGAEIPDALWPNILREMESVK